LLVQRQAARSRGRPRLIVATERPGACYLVASRLQPVARLLVEVSNRRIRKEETMKKLAIIGLVVAGLVTPASAAAGQLRHHVRSCCREPIFQHGKNISFRGEQVFRNTVTVWVHDPISGRVTPIPYGKWRTEEGR
jgi:hypothetical protein